MSETKSADIKDEVIEQIYCEFKNLRTLIARNSNAIEIILDLIFILKKQGYVSREEIENAKNEI